jgi:hypothetical protein
VTSSVLATVYGLLLAGTTIVVVPDAAPPAQVGSEEPSAYATASVRVQFELTVTVESAHDCAARTSHPSKTTITATPR